MISLDDKLVFIVGNSRSGTTMMMRIMKKHSEIHSLNEIHFFEKFWSTADRERPVEEEEAVWLASRLLFIDRYNVLEDFKFEEFEAEARTMLSRVEKNPLYRQDIYHAMLNYRTQKEGKTIACEKTPQNLFYVKDLLEMYPNCLIINMVRDPRGVLLSQKKKWMRKDSKDSYIKDHKKEVRRLKMNYHPITISKLWNSAIQTSEKFESDPRVMTLRFEDITNQPEVELNKVTDFLGLPYEVSMLNVEYNGSSTELRKGEKQFGIRKTTTQSWRKGLTKAEIFICQWITGKYYGKYGYEKVPVGFNPFAFIYHLVSFPVKLAGSLMLNLNRMRNISEAIKRRLFA